MACALTTACERRPDSGPVVVSVIGEPAKFDATAPDTPLERTLTGAVAEGLVRFDANGQIEPGLAERWIVIDDGLRYIFRLRAGQWSDGERITTAQVVTVLKRRINDPANPLAPYLTAIDEIVEMTPQVIEIRLRRPRPDLLKLFAQPELALPRMRPPGGGGPFRIAPGRDLLLTPVIDPNRAEDETDDAGPRPERNVRLIGERAARAVARFANRDSDLVLGGSFVDWPLTTAAGVARGNLRVDPAVGLFGLAVVRREGLLATPAGRAAVAGAIDRAAIVASFAPELLAVDTLLPERLDSAATPVQPVWAAVPPAERRANAQRAVAAARLASGGVALAPLRIALPPGPGATLLFRRLRAALAAVGLDSEQVAFDDPHADLRLIDRVAPFDSARWYIKTACQPCSAQAAAAIEAARVAPSLAERARAIAEADAALADDVAFIPLMRPLRWSLVALRLRAFQGNPRAWHPLNHLRNDPD